MKKVTFVIVSLLLSILQTDAQKKQVNVKKAPTKPVTSAQTSTKKSKEVTESATQPLMNQEEIQKKEFIPLSNTADIILDQPIAEKQSLSYEEVFTTYKQKIDRIEKDFATKKAGIQKDASLSKEERQSRINEYNTYRTQLLTEIFGQKNYEKYQQSIKQ